MRTMSCSGTWSRIGLHELITTSSGIETDGDLGLPPDSMCSVHKLRNIRDPPEHGSQEASTVFLPAFEGETGSV